MEVNSKDARKLEALLTPDDFSPKKLVDFLKRYFRKEYEADAGVWEGYTIEDHTLMVLRQFERYYKDKELPGGIGNDLFRLTLALHDLGKPRAIEEGDKKLQQRYNLEILEKFLKKLNFKKDKIRLARAIVEGDPIGELIKGQKDESEIARYLREVSRGLNLGSLEFLELKLIYYKVDAGSYTEDAGGKRSLDHLFVFDHESPKLEFSTEIRGKIESLRENFMNEVKAR